MTEDKFMINYDFNGKGKFGFICPKYNNQIIYFPIQGMKGHIQSVSATMVNLFPDLVIDFAKFYENTRNYCPSQINFLDQEELEYALFWAQKQNVVFLNSSTPYSKSGILAIPADIEELSNFQKNTIKQVIEHFNTLTIEDNLFSILYVNNERVSQETGILFHENEPTTSKSI